jgi:hypothetical protein
MLLQIELVKKKGNAIIRNSNGNKYVIRQITFSAVHKVDGLDLKMGWKENAESSCE